MSLLFYLLEKALLPDALLRLGIRGLLKKKLEAESRGGTQAIEARRLEFIAQVKKSPISILTDAANKQHYELPAAFFEKIMGRHIKNSSGFWREGVRDLNQSEEDMLALTVERAQLEEGQEILELGCGWGSLTLWMAQKFPKSRITALSNSKSQKKYIDQKAAERSLTNITVLTEEMSRFTTDKKYDRIVTVEMFEHMRNYDLLFKKVAGFLKENGKVFIHVFSHKKYAYFYEDHGPDDWMTRYFFSGGTMPSDDLFFNFQQHLNIEKHWQVSGTHYQKTCRAWLQNMDRHDQEIQPILKEVYGKASKKWRIYWRVFFMACEELFAYDGGNEWGVSHYLLHKKATTY